MVEEYCLDDEICDLVVEMAKQNAPLTISLLCGLLIGVAESCAQNQGQNPNAKMEFVGAPRTIVIESGTT
jgi:hypothetical protein